MIEVNGASLEVVARGEGDPLVLVHGSASDHRTWRAQRDAWSDRFRVIAYSRRYHWPNDEIEPGGTYSLDEHVDDLRVLLETLETGPAHLVGHSYGGLVVLLAAARSPALAASLVLVEPPATGLFVNVPPSPVELLKLALRRPRTALSIAALGGRALGPAEAALERGDVDEAMRRMGHGVLGKEAYRVLSSARREQIRDNLILEEFRSSEAMPRLDLDEIRSVGCPVLLVEGEESPVVFSRLLDRLVELLPHARRTAVPGASHNVHEDRPGTFDDLVASFLDRRAARGGGPGGRSAR